MGINRQAQVTYNYVISSDNLTISYHSIFLWIIQNCKEMIKGSVRMMRKNGARFEAPLVADFGNVRR